MPRGSGFPTRCVSTLEQARSARLALRIDLPSRQPFVELLLDDFPTPGKTFAHVPSFETRVGGIGQRFAHDLAEFGNQPTCRLLSSGISYAMTWQPRCLLRIPFELLHAGMLFRI